MEESISIKCKYCGKEFDSKYKLCGHIIRCKENPKSKINIEHCNNIKKYNYKRSLIQTIGYCSYCGKECKNLNSLKQHEVRCKENPNRKDCKGNHKSHVAWNKGLTKETDERVKKCGLSYTKNYNEGKFKIWCEGKLKETDERINNYSKKVSNTIKSKVTNNDWHLSFSKARTIEYKNEKFQGTWEVNFAKQLDFLNIKWIRPLEKFDYIFNNEIHKYIPDFYLPEYDLYIEIKGYPTEKDFIKWNNFPKDKQLDIYFGDELKQYNIVSEIKESVYQNIPEIYRYKHIQIFKAR